MPWVIEPAKEIFGEESAVPILIFFIFGILFLVGSLLIIARKVVELWAYITKTQSERLDYIKKRNDSFSLTDFRHQVEAKSLLENIAAILPKLSSSIKDGTEWSRESENSVNQDVVNILKNVVDFLANRIKYIKQTPPKRLEAHAIGLSILAVLTFGSSIPVLYAFVGKQEQNVNLSSDLAQSQAYLASEVARSQKLVEVNQNLTKENLELSSITEGQTLAQLLVLGDDLQKLRDAIEKNHQVSPEINRALMSVQRKVFAAGFDSDREYLGIENFEALRAADLKFALVLDASGSMNLLIQSRQLSEVYKEILNELNPEKIFVVDTEVRSVENPLNFDPNSIIADGLTEFVDDVEEILETFGVAVILTDIEVLPGAGFGVEVYREYTNGLRVLVARKS